MTPPPLIDTNGRPLPLDRQLDSGGEAAVFTLPLDPNRLVKVYHQPPTAQTVEKLAAMIALANPQLTSVSAWPTGLVFNARTRQVAGFVMPRLIDFQPIQHLYNPVKRLRFFPRAGWAFQIRAAQNLAAAFDEVHKAGCLVGDVNEKNAFVSSVALVRLIDCDSFQVRANGKQFTCEVGVPLYIPPELQGKSLRGLVRTENHDRFGLAVLLYQLLFVGRHPYAGVYRGTGDPSFQELIAEFRFAQGPSAHSWDMDPPPNTPTFADIPPDIAMLFRQAFERGSESGGRPRPSAWLIVLKQLEQNLAVCGTDAGHAYWGGAKTCTWCRLAANGGPEYYFGVAGSAGTFAVDEAKLQDVVRRLTTPEPVEFAYDRSRFHSNPAPNPKPLPSELDRRRPSGFFATMARIWYAMIGSRSPWDREFHSRKTAHDRKLNSLATIELEWEEVLQRYHRERAELTRSVHRLISDCRALTSQHQAELRRLTTHAEETARIRHLRLHLLTDADIPKIGAGRKQVLASHQIFSAADVEWNTIIKIKGFGATLTSNLMVWKEEVLRQFRFDPITEISPAEQRPVTVKFRALQQQILQEMDRQLTKIESLGPACRAAIRKLIPALTKAVAAWDQAEADLSLMK